jgi:hypothetical protein
MMKYETPVVANVEFTIGDFRYLQPVAVRPVPLYIISDPMITGRSAEFVAGGKMLSAEIEMTGSRDCADNGYDNHRQAMTKDNINEDFIF